jgi:hypothetical protein
MGPQPVSPTQLSLAHLRRNGWIADICERWVPNGGPGPGVRRDLFGLVDLVAVRGSETMGVQTTSASNVAAHLRKMTDDEHAPALTALRAAGWAVVVHGWRKSTRDGMACRHDQGARCGCRWTLHRLVDVAAGATT